MQLFQDLKYVGENKALAIYGDSPWHCTSFTTMFSTGEMVYMLQQPHYFEGDIQGYSGLCAYIFTEDELVENFKIIKEDGTLEDIEHSKDNKRLQENLKKIEERFKNMTEEEVRSLLYGDEED